MKPARKRNLDKQERRKKTVRILFYLNAIMWLVNGGIFVSKMIEDSNTITAAMVGFFFLFNVLTLIVAASILATRESWVYIVALVITGLNTLLLFIGFLDILDAISAVINVIIFANLIPLKSFYYKEA